MTELTIGTKVRMKPGGSPIVAFKPGTIGYIMGWEEEDKCVYNKANPSIWNYQKDGSNKENKRNLFK